MKLTIDKATIDVVGTVSLYSLNIQVEDALAQVFLHSYLRSLMVKLSKAKDRVNKKTTLHLTPAEALAYKFAVDFWNNDLPGSYEYQASMQYFLQPLLKSCVDKKQFTPPVTDSQTNNAQA